MYEEGRAKKIFYYLGLVCALSILYRAVIANLLNGICELAGFPGAFSFKSPEVMTQLITLAGMLIGARGFESYVGRSKKKGDSEETKTPLE